MSLTLLLFEWDELAVRGKTHVSWVLLSGGEWTVLSEEVTDSCFVVKDLPKGASYVFRMGCITKTGAGPFSDASAPVVMATHPEGKNNISCCIFTAAHDSYPHIIHPSCYIWWSETRQCKTLPFDCVLHETLQQNLRVYNFLLLYRKSDSSNPDWVIGVKGHRVNTQELQNPVRDQQVRSWFFNN